MRKSDACPTKYFRAADLPADWELTAEIEMARIETFEGDRDKGDAEKLVVYFRKQKSGLVCGPTIWDQLIEATNEEDSDDWPGHTSFSCTEQWCNLDRKPSRPFVSARRRSRWQKSRQRNQRRSRQRNSTTRSTKLFSNETEAGGKFPHFLPGQFFRGWVT